MADKQKAGVLCCECKENEVMKKRGRKFRHCYDCRVKDVQHRLKGRKRYAELKSSVGRIVGYYDDGGRIGFLVLLRRGGAAIQPLGSLYGSLPREVTVRLDNVWPEKDSKGWTLEAYLASRKPKVLVAKPVETEEPAPVKKLVPSLPVALQPTIAVQEKPVCTEREQTKKVNTPKNGFVFDKARAVELYKTGTKIAAIAEELHGPYALGHTGNLVRAALREAGVYEKK